MIEKYFDNRRLLQAAVSAAALASLAGCTGGMNAAVVSLRQIVTPQRQDAQSKLDPKFEYLRVTRGRHVGLLWRGSVERTPQGAIEVYYSGTGEVVRLLNGRLVGAAGLTTEWRQVQVEAPAWSDVAKAQQPRSLVRVRDVMPGYRSGVRDELLLRVTAPPPSTALVAVDPVELTWFEESIRAPAGSRAFGEPADTLPPARYAVSFAGGREIVVYGEQCLVRDLCFTWQRWSAAMQASVTAARTE